MNNPIIRDEFAGDMLGVSGRFSAVTIGGKNYKPGTFTKQEFSATRDYTDSHGTQCRLRVKVRFDDNCRNGHNSFAVTGSGFEMERGRWVETFGGCCHDEIAAVFPELAPLIKWHLVSSDGPMHYVANTVYHASNRDHWGKLKCEPRQWETVIQFGNNPIKHKLKSKFIAFLQNAAAHPGKSRFDFEVVPFYHEDQGKPGKYQFGPKYTFGGFADKWHECPFDDEDSAVEFLMALQSHDPQFVRIPTAWGEGKERNLDAARNAGVWPDAHDSILLADKETLTAALLERLPALVAEFREDIARAGLLWAPE